MTETCLGIDTIVGFVDGPPDAALRSRIEHHASHCAACRDVLSALACSGTPPLRRPPRNDDRPLAPGTPVGRYVVAHEIGAGGMGVVYAAHDPVLARQVALKLLHDSSDPRLQDRLRREAQVMAQLAHPNVLAVYDVGVLDGRMFIAIEHVAGETLARWSAAPRSQREILDAYCEAGRGLAAAHAAGIVHRDFKPENVLIGHDGRVRVGDFGLARAVGSPDDAPPAPAPPDDRAAPRMLVGTPCYMAPELYRGASADARSDQFSFCVALFRALYGERPFAGDTLGELAANVRAGRLRDVRARTRIPRRIRAALRRGLSADPAARFASLPALLAELAPRPPRASWRTAAGAVLGVVGLLLAHAQPGPPDPYCTRAMAALAAAWNAEPCGTLDTAAARRCWVRLRAIVHALTDDPLQSPQETLRHVPASPVFLHGSIPDLGLPPLPQGTPHEATEQEQDRTAQPEHSSVRGGSQEDPRWRRRPGRAADPLGGREGRRGLRGDPLVPVTRPAAAA